MTPRSAFSLAPSRFGFQARGSEAMDEKHGQACSLDCRMADGLSGEDEMRLREAVILVIAFASSAALAETRELRDRSGATTGHMRDDGRGGFDLQDGHGSSTGRMKNDSRGGFYLEDQHGSSTGRMKSDSRGGFYLEDQHGSSTGRMRSDGRGGFYLEDQHGSSTGRMKNDSRGGFYLEDQHGSTVGTIGAPH